MRTKDKGRRCFITSSPEFRRRQVSKRSAEITAVPVRLAGNLFGNLARDGDGVGKDDDARALVFIWKAAIFVGLLGFSGLNEHRARNRSLRRRSRPARI